MTLSNVEKDRRWKNALINFCIDGNYMTTEALSVAYSLLWNDRRNLPQETELEAQTIAYEWVGGVTSTAPAGFARSVGEAAYAYDLVNGDPGAVWGHYAVDCLSYDAISSSICTHFPAPDSYVFLQEAIFSPLGLEVAICFYKNPVIKTGYKPVRALLMTYTKCVLVVHERIKDEQ